MSQAMKLDETQDEFIYQHDLPTAFDEEGLSQLEELTRSWDFQKTRSFVFNFKGVGELPSSLIKIVTQLAIRAKKEQGYVASLHLSPLNLKDITDRGLKSTFNPVKSLREVYSALGVTPSLRKPKVDVKFLNTFIESARKTLETQVNTSLTHGAPTNKSKDLPKVEIAGVINLTCSDFSGLIAICFSSEVFLNMYENMLGERPEKIDGEVKDAAAEILNIIFGGAKTVLVEQGYNIERAIPTVMTGDNLEVSFKGDQPEINLPFESGVGRFFIKILIS